MVGDDGYTLAENRRTRRRNRPTEVGTKESTFRGCRPRMDHFIGRVPKEWPEQHMRDMVVDKQVEIVDLKKTSHTEAPMSSYKLTIWRDDADKLIQPTAWPQFITCRCWTRPRRHSKPAWRRGYDPWDEAHDYWDAHSDT